MDDTFCQSGYLYLENLFATFLQCVAGRSERMRVNGAGQYRLAGVFRQGERDCYCFTCQQGGGPVHEASICLAVVLQVLDVDFTDDELFLHGEARGFFQ